MSPQRDQLGEDCRRVWGGLTTMAGAGRRRGPDGRSLHSGHPPVDWYTLNRWVLEEKMDRRPF